ncbi:Crp/Fnr family transcriptional regulator [bacterium SCSIO 12741]|nr:Crp/Fnr family transcriptional regulator [bacterium SCSIO 12741]
MSMGFRNYLAQRIELTSSDWELVEKYLPARPVQKGELLLQEGEISKSFFFNQSGFIRLYYTLGSEERTAWFYPENQFISAYASFVRQEPSQMNLQAMEDGEVIEITLEASMALLQGSPRFEALARMAMEEELISHQDMVQMLLTLTPEERFASLLEKNPEVFTRIPQHYIASYLGMQPESLSRIKKRYYQKS